MFMNIFLVIFFLSGGIKAAFRLQISLTGLLLTVLLLTVLLLTVLLLTGLLLTVLLLTGLLLTGLLLTVLLLTGLLLTGLLLTGLLLPLIIISCHQTVFFHLSAHSLPVSLNCRRSSKVQGRVRSEHCNKCAVFSVASPHTHVVSPS